MKILLCPLFRSLMIALTAAVLMLSSASAQVSVGSGDVSAFSYDYTLSSVDLGNGAISALVGADTSNIAYTLASGTNGRASATVGTTSAVLTLGWDFSSSGYVVTEFSIQDSVALFNWSPYGRTTEATVEYTTDLSGPWTTLYTLDSALLDGVTANPYTVIEDNTSTPIAGVLTESADSFYYRVTYTATGNAFGDELNQWGRIDFDGNKFAASFDLAAIPEPSVASFTMGVVALCYLGGRRRRSAR